MAEEYKTDEEIISAALIVPLAITSIGTVLSVAARKLHKHYPKLTTGIDDTFENCVNSELAAIHLENTQEQENE